MVEPRFDADAGTLEARRTLPEQNRLSWNAATRAHNSHKADQARFYGEGGGNLHPEEVALLGDLTGTSVEGPRWAALAGPRWETPHSLHVRSRGAEARVSALARLVGA